ncbi:grasp-with-spasm system ATP-grasp peptide maturase [Chryseobacterium flavum]|uniref:grasp-with-spasm system ATP-grasp peptide maturase n=1 Tax=Chryseobacterium flavum TaxID=415851 RepID=UPI0028A6A199|nr:grasp-with-spasm system ATP-grasp peptide maturase [Chryseobacterium flavum]
MILILSRSDDGSTNKIIDWLFLFGKKFIRLNGNKANYEIKRINNNEVIVSIEGNEINILEASSVWYRRNGFGHTSFEYTLSKNALKDVLKREIDQFYVYDQIRDEFRVIFEYINFLIETKIPNRLGSFFKREINKMITLYHAEQSGFQIPTSYILSKKEDLREKQGLVTKALKDGVYLLGKEYEYYSYTERITDEIVESTFESSFLPSLFQKEIKKKYELRVFYLKGEIFSTVIFSQQKATSAVDFRKDGHSIRYIPYSLPDDIREKINNLMTKLNHNIGAIDLIVDINDNYIFLEVNPGGQFSYYSDMCNFYIEKKIAEIL